MEPETSSEEEDPIYLYVPPQPPYPSSSVRQRHRRNSGTGNGGSSGSNDRGTNSAPRAATNVGNPGSRFTTYLLTATGRKYHGDRQCVGLQNAHAVFQSVLCEDCEPRSTGPQRRLWSLGPGYLLHRAPNHTVHPETGQEMKPYDPCKICL